MKRFRMLISLVLVICLCQGMLFTVNAAETSASPLDTWENNLSTIKNILSGRLVMVLDSPKYFLNGTAYHYDNTDARNNVYPVERGDSAIVPAEAFIRTFNLSFSMDGNVGTFTYGSITVVMTAGNTTYTNSGSSAKAEVAPEIINGTFYVPIQAFAEAFGKKVYMDLNDTGLIMVGTNNTPFNSTAKEALKAEIARATRYERPDAATVIADMEAFQDARKANGETAHPRINITENKIKDLKNQIAADAFTAKIYEGIKDAAEANYKIEDSTTEVNGVDVPTVTNGIPQYSVYYGNQISSIDWHTWIEDMMLVYWIEGAGYDYYLQRSKDILLSVAQWPNYGTYESLSTSGASVSLSIGYDWLYNYLTPDERALVKDAIVTKCMEPDLTRYNYTIKPSPEYGYTLTFHRWPTWGNNFTSKGNQGVSHAIVAVWDELWNGTAEDKELLTEMLRYMFRSQELALDFLLPDGGGNEGLDYLLGGSVSESAAAFLNIINATGKDYGYLQSRSFKDALENLIYMEGAEGLYNFGDADWRPVGNYEPKESHSLLFWMGQHISPLVYNYRKDVLENYLGTFPGWRNAGYTAYDLLYYDPEFEIDEHELTLGKYYRGTEYMGVRESWDKMADSSKEGRYMYKDNFLGFKGGLGTGTHTHRDLGSFIWDANGIRWFGDPGRCLYAYGNSVVHSALYTNRAEGHNVLMFRNVNDLLSLGEPNEDGHYLLKEDDFETTSVGSAPNWGVVSPEGTVVEVVKDNDSNSKHSNVLHLNSDPDCSDARIDIEFSPDRITDYITIEYDLKVNSMEESSKYVQILGLFLYDKDGNRLGHKQFNSIYYNTLNGVSYDKNQWYHLKTTINLADGKYSTYVYDEKDTLIGKNENVNITYNDIPQTSLTVYDLQFSTMGGAAVDCYLDNIEIYVHENNSENIIEIKRNAPDQSTSTVAKIENFVNSPSSAFGIANLSKVYPDYSSDYKRGAGLFGNREYVVIRDEATVNKDCETYWFGHTLADIELRDDKNAILTDSKTGKKAWVGIVSDGPETFSTMSATPFPESSQDYNSADNIFKTKQKLTIESNRVEGEEIALTIMMKALDDGEDIPTLDELPEVLPLSQWSADNTPLVQGGFVAGAQEGEYKLNGNITTANGGKVLPVIAVYDDDTNELINVKLFKDEKDLNANLPRELSLGIKIPDAKLEKGGKVTLKAFIWDGVEKLTPYSTFFEKNLDLPAQVNPAANEVPAE